MTPQPGEVYMVDLGVGGKTRPMMVASRFDPEAPRALALCIPVTTQNRGTAYEVELPRVRFLREQSWANVQGLQAVRHDELRRLLGRFEAVAVEQVRKALRFVLDL